MFAVFGILAGMMCKYLPEKMQVPCRAVAQIFALVGTP